MKKEHPRPQLFRPDWENLNGQWDFEFDFSNSGLCKLERNELTLTKKINVPFCPESSLSGLGFTDFIQAVWYAKTFNVSEEKLSGRIILHFGAVDYFSKLWVNGSFIGEHTGGYSSFEFDITDAVVAGENKILLYALDDLRSGKQPRGKQCPKFYSAGCDYTRTTGIWQTVWLEYVPKTYIKSLRMIPDAVNGRLSLAVKTVGDVSGFSVKAEAAFDGQSVGSVSVKTNGAATSFDLNLNETHLWDIDSPNLYDLTITLSNGTVTDKVTSYFGLRTVEWKNGAMYLNNRPLFQRLVLDQGFYKDGIYTAPTDEDLVNDIKLSMDLGFNGARLHEKVFEERFLYHADRLGYLVWGEHANWGLDITTAEGIKNFLPEWLEVVERDFNHPAIVGWCPFNETWDTSHAKQDDAVLRTVYLATKAIDPTRPVIDTSGNYHVVTDIYDVHDYEQDIEIFRSRYENLKPGEVYETFPNRQKHQGQPYFVSEYGGAWWSNAGGESWGYGKQPTSEEEVCLRYEGLTGALLKSEGVCAFCYTQLYDVEQEQNGLYTYERKRKFSDEIYERIKKANTAKARIEE